MSVIPTIIGVVALIAALIVWGRANKARATALRAAKRYADEFIFINEDGSARELTDGERDHLNAEFRPDDSGRPYIKSRYKQRTPDGNLLGYLQRRKLPRHVTIVRA